MRLAIKKILPVFAISVLSLFFFYSCGKGGASETASLANSNPSPDSPNRTVDQALIAIPISMNHAEEVLPSLANLNLAAPGSVSVTSYVMALASCVSGLSGNTSAATINVYLYDTNCKAKLTSFVLNGVSYTPSVNFTTWNAGDTATFTGSGNTVYIQVVSQLSSPINVSDVVSYNFRFNKLGTNDSNLTVSSSQSLIAAGQDAPNFQLTSGNAIFNNIINTGLNTGAGVFTFNITCVNTMVVGGSSPSLTFCPTLPASSNGTDLGPVSGTNYFSYKLIADASCTNTLSLAQAQSAFQAGGDSTVTIPGNLIANGFTTGQMTGPVSIASNRCMILILQSKNSNPTYTSNPLYSSFQYFPITLPTVNP